MKNIVWEKENKLDGMNYDFSYSSEFQKMLQNPAKRNTTSGERSV
ncbi:Uncharacterized protein dnl_55310 [Desulfonema limicola]|uniref:Uncharacterized protein n=1 Tax=Desulfonema limicola TaxID=45656 RepID=A0A975BCV8_9BACT|nr:hypothetical protein [Desulfonema limicola]QTA83137.1 Uncharacterized protein dnl_55310 [Desulfonema limicola]